MVIHKSSGIGIHQENDTPGLFQRVKEDLNLKELFPVHRLDKVTSGLLILAKDKVTAQQFGKLFSSGAVEKYYLALSAKKPGKKQGMIKGDMEKARRGAWKLLRSQNNPAITRFKSFGTTAGVRVFAIKPQTGKTHQIRVALKSLGAPILGDKLYGGDIDPPADRTYLHAIALRFSLKNKNYSYCEIPHQGKYFQLPEVQQVIQKSLSPPWNLPF